MNTSSRKGRIAFEVVGMCVLVAAILAIRSPASPSPSNPPGPHAVYYPVAHTLPIGASLGKPSDLSLDKQALRSKVIEDVFGGASYTISPNGKNYTITYSPPPLDDFDVSILTEPFKNVKLESEQWFMDQGFSQAELCNVSVNFYPGTAAVGKANPTYGALPDGCPYP